MLPDYLDLDTDHDGVKVTEESDGASMYRNSHRADGNNDFNHRSRSREDMSHSGLVQKIEE
jgi:arylamine N-acetyltransferase